MAPLGSSELGRYCGPSLRAGGHRKVSTSRQLLRHLYHARSQTRGPEQALTGSPGANLHGYGHENDPSHPPGPTSTLPKGVPCLKSSHYSSRPCPNSSGSSCLAPASYPSEPAPQTNLCPLCMCAESLLSRNPKDHSPPGFSVHGILQSRTLEWVAMPFSRGSSQSRDRTCISQVSCIGKRVLYHWHGLGSQT